MNKKQELINYWKNNYNFTDEELDVFNKIPRESFINEQLYHLAYEDAPLPSLRGKTISQPTTVMIMTHALNIKKGDKILEIGTGSGYQTSILALLAGDNGKVISTEIIPELVVYARANIKKLGITNVTILEEDGSRGIINEIFDKIIITAACKEFPDNLIEQLKVGGVIVGPVGDRNLQSMTIGMKDEFGNLHFIDLGNFLFSPLYGKYGFEI